LLSTIVFS